MSFLQNKELPINEEDLQKKMKEFRKQVIKNKKYKYFKDKFQNDPRNFIEIPTQCAVSFEPLKIPVRNQNCNKPECLFNLEDLIKSFGEEIYRQNYKCKVCHSYNSNTNFFFDVSTAFFLNEAKKKFENFEQEIDQETIQFGIDLKKGNTYCVKRGKELINLHKSGQQKKNQQSDQFTQDQHKEEVIKDLQKEMGSITDKIIDHVKNQANVYKCLKMDQNIQIDHQQFINQFKESLSQNITIQTSDQSSQFYENQWCYSLNIDYQKKQYQFFIYVPCQQRWYKFILENWRSGNNPIMENLEYSTLCRGYSKRTKQHSIFIIGGQNQENKSLFYNRVLEIPLFQNVPQEIKSSISLIQKANMNHSKAMVNCVTYNDRIYCFGGFVKVQNESFPVSSNTCEYYDMFTGQWSPLPNMPKPTILLNFVKINKKCYFFGGYDEANQQSIKTQNMDLFIFDFKTHNFNCMNNVLPNLQQIQEQECVKYFRGRGFAFSKFNDQTFCVFGGRNLDEQNFQHKNSNTERKYYMSEFNLDSKLWGISNVKLERTSTKSINQSQFNQQSLDFDDKKIQDFEPVYWKDNVYFQYFYSSPKLAIYDEYETPKLRQEDYDSKKCYN